jgi:Ca-activated chloride channel family protein
MMGVIGEMYRWRPLAAASVVAVLLTTALAFDARVTPCRSLPVTITSYEEKSALLAQLASDFNAGRPMIAGSCLKISVVRRASGATQEALAHGWDEQVDGPRPDAWSPAASTWILLLNQRLADDGHPAMADQNSPSLARSPLVIGMPKPMAVAMGWPDRPIGWAEFLQLARDRTGWSSFGHPEWAYFQLGKTNPLNSTSGLHALIAAYFAASARSSGLTTADLVSAPVTDFVRSLESSVVHYGDSVSTFLLNLQAADDRGAALSYISAVAVEEKQILDYNRGNPTGDPAKDGKHLWPAVPLAAVYPKEGTLAADHPFAVLTAPWVTAEKRSGARAFLAYLQEPAQQRRFQDAGFRDLRGFPGSAIVRAKGVLPEQPSAYLQLPPARVISQLQASWRGLRKSARFLLVIDASGWSSHNDFAQIQRSIEAGLEQLNAADTVGIWCLPAGSEQVLDHRILAQLGQVQVIRPGLNKALATVQSSAKPGAPLRATVDAVAAMAAGADPSRINAVVLVGGGHSAPEDLTLDRAQAELSAQSNQTPGVRVFTVAYGEHPDLTTLGLLAMAGRGGFYDASTPSNIGRALAAAISNF